MKISSRAFFSERRSLSAIRRIGSIFNLIVLTFYFFASGQVNAQNAITTENLLVGNLPSEWDIIGVGDPSIQGFATDISVNRGQVVNFKISTDAAAYRVDIYRLGYYSGRGARKVASVTPTASLPQSQPQFLRDAATGLVDCGNWAVSASWTVPAGATSGVYIARPVRLDTGGASHIVFIVRDDAGNSDLLFQTSDTTWQAYNLYGGASLYYGNGPSPDGGAYKVSYNRPFDTRGVNHRVSFLFAAEYPMIRWLEANGYSVSYASGVDTDRRGGAGLTPHKVFLSVGHDEYWSGGQRANVETARGAGVHLGFFSGNEIFWKTRWENSIDGIGTPYRTLVCYKETHANAKRDPTPAWTGTWRDPRFSPPADGGRPENALTGQIFTVNGDRTDPMLVASSEGKLRFWRNTSMDTLLGEQKARFPAGILGYEWDEALDNGFQPTGLIRMSKTTLRVDGSYIQDLGSTYGLGVATHSLTLYRHGSGSLVFGAGTVQWSWGLDATHDLAGPPADLRMQQATINLFADMGVQPATLKAGLVVASQSTDLLPPTSVIQTPAGLTVPAWTPFSVFGTATDLGGGRPAAVEVSADGGTTWHPAIGATNWTAELMAGGPGSATIRSRAIDDSGRVESPGTTATIVVTGNSFRSSLWSPEDTPVLIDQVDPQPVELGVMFQSDRNGWITALRFYKAPTNTGVHVGNLWTNGGTLLASVTFTNETASGWQQAELPTPVPIVAGTLYVVSYHMENGHYSRDAFYFSGKGVDRSPLHAPADGVVGFNGRYHYGTSGYPSESSQSANYWVDVVYALDPNPDTTPPIVTARTPGDGVLGVSPRASLAVEFSENMLASTIGASSFSVRDSLNDIVPSTVNYDPANRVARLQPSVVLNPNVTYTATVKGGPSGVSDLAGNRLPGDFIWSLTTAPLPSGPSTLWASDTTPTALDSSDQQAQEVGVRFYSDFDGWITALRFYKSATNTGVHVGNLWTSGGTLLASVTFAGETASGWQQAQLATPVPILAGSSYIASYHTQNGHYSVDNAYFAGIGVDRGPLHAPADSPSEPNGLYILGPSAFPTNSSQSKNYWVDVVFTAPTQTALPIFTPPSTSFSGTLSVVLSDATPGAQIYYTTNGTTPTRSSTLYAGPIILSTTTTLKAIAVASGSLDSPVVIANYTLLPTPTAPSGLSAVALSGSQINLTWTDNSTNETGFKVERKTGAGGTYAQIAAASANVASYSDTTAGSSTVYFYRVRATNVAGNSAYSNEVMAVSSTATAGPGSLQGDYYDNADLTNLKFSRLDPAVSFDWVDGSPDVSVGVDTFSARWTGKIEPLYSQTYTFYTTSDDGVRLWVNGQLVINNWTDHSPTENSGTLALAANQLYDILLEFYENGGGAVAQLSWSSASQTKQIIPSSRFYTTFPKPPTSLSATAASVSQINLAWTDAANNEGGFRVERSLDGVNFSEIATVGANATTYISTGLSANTSYTYRVRAFSLIGTSSYSNLANSTTQNAKPAAPGGLTASAVSASQIDLLWMDNSSNETGFKIERKTGSGGTYTQVAAVGAGVTTYSNTGLTGSTTYFFRIRATNAIGDSIYSTEASGTTPIAPVGAPSALTATPVSSSQINLVWVDNATNETGFKIERKAGSGGAYAQVAIVGAGVTAYTNTGLIPATVYFYRVRATNAAGDSTYSPEANATTTTPSFRAGAFKGAASGVKILTINKPTGTQSGDVMVAAVAIRPSTATITASGWTLVRRMNNTSGNSNALAVYYKVAGVSEPTTYDWTFSNSTGSAGGIRSFSGVDSVSPVDVEAGQSTASNLSHTAPSVTTRFSSDMVVASHSFASSATFVAPSGMVEAFDISSETALSTSGVSIEGSYLLQTAVAATGTRTATASNDADTGNAHILALKPK